MRRAAGQIYVAAYDIEDDSVRLKAARVLEAWGFVRVQRSLYVGRLQRARAQDLIHLLARILQGKGHIVLLPLTDDLLERRLEAGTPPYAPLTPPRAGGGLLAV